MLRWSTALFFASILAACGADPFVPCGGDPEGVWITDPFALEREVSAPRGASCAAATTTQHIRAEGGTATFRADGSYRGFSRSVTEAQLTIPASCAPDCPLTELGLQGIDPAATCREPGWPCPPGASVPVALREGRRPPDSPRHILDVSERLPSPRDVGGRGPRQRRRASRNAAHLDRTADPVQRPGVSDRGSDQGSATPHPRHADRPDRTGPRRRERPRHRDLARSLHPSTARRRLCDDGRIRTSPRIGGLGWARGSNQTP